MTMRAISEATALVRLLSPPRAGLRILMYHAVGSPVYGDERGIFSTAPDLFEAHMTALVQHGAASTVPVTADRTVEPSLRVAITFDDGYRDNLKAAAPILDSHGFPYAVFVISEFVRKNTASFLSEMELRELSSRPGVTIGAHGANHVSLTRCDDRTLANELVSSKRYLEDIVGKPVTTLAYPHGSVNRRVRDAAEKAGYSMGFTSHFDINAPERDPLLLGRTTVLGTDDVRVFRQKLHGDWDWYRWRSTDPAAS